MPKLKQRILLNVTPNSTDENYTRPNQKFQFKDPAGGQIHEFTYQDFTDERTNQEVVTKLETFFITKAIENYDTFVKELANFNLVTILSALSKAYSGLELINEPKLQNSCFLFYREKSKLYCRVTIEDVVIPYNTEELSDPFTIEIVSEYDKLFFCNTISTELDKKREKILLSNKLEKEKIYQSLVDADLKRINSRNWTLLIERIANIQKLSVVLTQSDTEKIDKWIASVKTIPEERFSELPLDIFRFNLVIADSLLSLAKREVNENIAKILLVLIEKSNLAMSVAASKTFLFQIFNSQNSFDKSLAEFANRLKIYINSDNNCDLVLLFESFNYLARKNILDETYKTIQESIDVLLLNATKKVTKDRSEIKIKQIYEGLFHLFLNEAKVSEEIKGSLTAMFYKVYEEPSFSSDILKYCFLTFYQAELPVRTTIFDKLKDRLESRKFSVLKEAALKILGLDIDAEAEVFSLSPKLTELGKKLESAPKSVREVYTKLLVLSDDNSELNLKAIVENLFNQILLKTGIPQDQSSSTQVIEFSLATDSLCDKTTNSKNSTSNFSTDETDQAYLLEENMDAGLSVQTQASVRDSLREGMDFSIISPFLPSPSISSATMDSLCDKRSSLDTDSLYDHTDSENVSISQTDETEQAKLSEANIKVVLPELIQVSQPRHSLRKTVSLPAISLSIPFISSATIPGATIKNVTAKLWVYLVQSNGFYPYLANFDGFWKEYGDLTILSEIEKEDRQDFCSQFLHCFGESLKTINETRRILREAFNSSLEKVIDYKGSLDEFFEELEKGKSPSTELVARFSRQLRAKNYEWLKLLANYVEKQRALEKYVDRYNKFYYFERSRGGGDKVFCKEGKIEKLPINSLLKKFFLREVELFISSLPPQRHFDSLGVQQAPVTPAFNTCNTTKVSNAAEIEGVNNPIFSYIKDDFKKILRTEFQAIKKEIHSLENRINTFTSKSFFIYVSLAGFWVERAENKLKKAIYANYDSSVSYEKQITNCIEEVKSLSRVKLFFKYGIFFLSQKSKSLIFEKITKHLYSVIYREKLSEINKLKDALDETLNATGQITLKESYAMASSFLQLIDSANSLLKFPIPDCLDTYNLVNSPAKEADQSDKLEIDQRDKKMEGKKELINNIKYFTEPYSCYWEQLLINEERKLNEAISSLEKETAKLLEKINTPLCSQKEDKLKDKTVCNKYTPPKGETESTSGSFNMRRQRSTNSLISYDAKSSCAFFQPGGLSGEAIVKPHKKFVQT